MTVGGFSSADSLRVVLVAISKMLVIGSIHRNELFLLVSAITQQVKGLRTGRTLPSTRLTRDCLGHYEIGRFVDGRILVAHCSFLQGVPAIRVNMCRGRR